VRSPGSYILINHTTGERFDDITVTGDQQPGDGQPGNGEAPVRNENFPPPSNDFNFMTRTIETSEPYSDHGEEDDVAPLDGLGNFRISCQYSHFAYDDPIRQFGMSGESDHLHMFFGNTDTNAYTTKDTIAGSGNGTCHGFELNRSAYWVPALLDEDGKAVVPQDIIVYYKSRQVKNETQEVQFMPTGLTMVAGNIPEINEPHVPSADSQHVFWSCGKSGVIKNKSGTIPQCEDDQQLNATIYFGQCWNKNKDLEDRNNGHIKKLEWIDQPCTGDHPYRLPELGILIYYPSAADYGPANDTSKWRLSSDPEGEDDKRGSTLHADFIAGWETETIETWTKNCLRNVDEKWGGRNCTFGQTGTNRQLAGDGNNFRWDGPYRVTPPPRGQ
jgi:hypothetical protein